MYQPLSKQDIERIHQTALNVLETIGFAESPPPQLWELMEKAGCSVNKKGRVCFPRALVEEMLAKASRDPIRFARDPDRDVDLSKGYLHSGLSVVAPNVIDFESGNYRPSTIVDNYDFIRLADRLDNIYFPSDCVGDANIPDPVEEDINKAYSFVAGTTKSGILHLNDPASLDSVIALLDTVLGAPGRFCERPFASVSIGPFRSPMTFHLSPCEMLFSCVSKGVPVSIAIVPQAGATSPTALAGTLVQMVAEALASYVLINLIRPGHKADMGLWPFVFDLRTGQCSSGSAEQGLLAAASAQIMASFGLITSVGAGMTDSKIPDNQAGFEKGVTALMAGLAGANRVTGVAGGAASLLSLSFEAMVIDDEELGALRRAVRGIEVTDDTLSYEVIKETMDGPQHFLHHPQTLKLMKTECYYPKLADRDTSEDWEKKGSLDIRQRGRKRAQKILSSHYPTYIEPAVDAKIRERFPIHLPREMMRAETGRW